MNNIIDLSLGQLKDKIESKELSAREAVDAVLARINATKNLNALITVCGDEAINRANELDNMENKSGKLFGVPIVVKDNISTCGIKTTCASKFLDNYIPPFDAFVVKQLKKEGAIIIGKANMDEFAMGSANENSAFGVCKNAVNDKHVPGGSSGGSACSVAAKQCFASLGSDTGGSIRQPASYCGVVGIKPTYSAVSRFGLVAFASSLDQIGSLARNVDDCQTVFNVIKGKDSLDATSIEYVPAASPDFSGGVSGLRIGIAKEFFSSGLDEEVKTRILETVAKLEAAGAVVVDTSISSFEAALATYYVLSSAEATSNLARFDGVKYGVRQEGKDYIDMYYNSRTSGFGNEVKRRIMMGNYVLSSGYYDAYYLKASRVRTLIKKDFLNAFSGCDVLISPVAPTVAPLINDKETDHAKVYLSDIYTVPVNIAGLPALSVPVGFNKNGLPIGMQIIGANFSENMLFDVAKNVEKLLK